MRCEVISVCVDIPAKLRQSHQDVNGNAFPLHVFPAVEPPEVDRVMQDFGLRWVYPMTRPAVCQHSGLKLHPYTSKDPKARIACALSHYLLWKDCAEHREPVMILEDDAVWLKPWQGFQTPYGAVSLNDPRNATRKAAEYHRALQAAKEPIAGCPFVDEDRLVPQGLPGHSAYVIHPTFARKLTEFVEVFGLWPNDAIMCRQLFPGQLGCVTDYLTTVSGRPSSLR